MNSSWKLKHTQTGKIISISKPVFKVGRNVNADLVSETNVLSRNHAVLSVLIDGLYVQDNKSLNGTFLNNKKLEPLEMHKIKHGDIIGFGCDSHMVAKNDIQSPFIFEILLEKPMEQEPSTSSTTNDSFYTTENNDFIVISDDEDDDPIASSQIFHITETIKKDELPHTDGIDPYFEIKEELQDLDFCNKEIEVDLTEDEEGCQNTMELIDILESSVKEVTSEEQQKVDVSENNSKTRNSTRRHTETGLPSKENITMKKNQSVTEISDDDLEKNNQKRSRRSLKSDTLKNKGPPIVEPHIMQNKCSGNKVGSNSKRKNVKDTTPQKKCKTSSLPNPLSSTVKKLEKETIMEERKRKLKELTKKGGRHTETSSSSKSHPKVKVSDGRGNFLLDQINIASTSTGGCLKTQNTEIQSSTVTNSCNSKIPSTTSPKSPLHEYYSPDSTVHDKIDPLQKTVFDQFVKPRNILPSKMRNECENVDTEVNRIVEWPIQWLVEQSNVDISPPVCGDLQPCSIPNYFKDYQEYVKIMTPLAFLELWQFIYQSACSKNDTREPIRVTIVHERRVDTVCYLDCECSLNENNPRTAIRMEDLAIVEVKLKDFQNCYKFVGFGVIKSCGRLNKNRLNPTFNFGFTVAIRNLHGKEMFDKKLLIKVITSMSSSLRLLRTPKYLKTTPICNLILNPNNLKTIVPSQGSTISGMRVNEEQKQITIEGSNFCLGEEPGIYLIKGPPGTGKSTVIVNLIFETLFKSKKQGQNPLILLTAPSNAAVDTLIMKLAEFRTKLLESQRRYLKLIRIGPEASISKNVEKFKLTYFAQKDVLNQCGLQYSEEFKKWTLSGGNLNDFLKMQLKHEYLYRIRNAEDKILLGSNVICTTLSSCVGYRLLQPTRQRKLTFTCCIIDEATQCTELESLLPIQLDIEKFILVGDPQQLPAVVCNKDAQKFGYGNSLFWRIDDCLRNTRNKDSKIRMLYTQYRMKPEICEYPNKKFYGGKLKSFPVCTRNNIIQPSIKPYLLFNLKTENDDSSEYVNKDEVTLINMLLEDLKCTVKTSSYTIGIITPYKAQKELLRRSIANMKFETDVLISVNTVDSFQGMENDIIIISCVRYNPNSFLQNEQRLNVALTRAKQALYVIGNYTLFKQSRPLYDLREDAKRRKICFDISIKNIKSLRGIIFD